MAVRWLSMSFMASVAAVLVDVELDSMDVVECVSVVLLAECEDVATGDLNPGLVELASSLWIFSSRGWFLATAAGGLRLVFPDASTAVGSFFTLSAEEEDLGAGGSGSAPI